MKAQMKFQKILSLVTLIVGALVFVFALCFNSGNLADLWYYNNANIRGKNVDATDNFYGADDCITSIQTFISVLVILGIVIICVAALLYITNTNKRRNYYITNYVAIGITIAVIAIVALYIIIDVSVLLSKFLSVDFAQIDYIRELTSTRTGNRYLPDAPEVSQSTTMFILAYVVAVIVLINAGLWALNLVWKRKLMKGEKALLERGTTAEVA